MTRVLVLGGGPDAEREVSIASAEGVYQGCLDADLDAKLEIVDRPGLREIESWQADVIFPVLHGEFGEGGALQTLLEHAGVAFVGSGFHAARLAMDKMATKLIAARLGIPSPAGCIFDPCGHHQTRKPEDVRSPFQLPVVIKPVADGSSVGLHICLNDAQWQRAVAAVDADILANPHRVYMIERYAGGREITVSVTRSPETGSDELIALPLIEIAPKDGVYDFEAKYQRHDTCYTINPELPERITAGMQQHALNLCEGLGIRHLARVDFLLSEDGHWTLLELNTMPGFTRTSLLPRAAEAGGLAMPAFSNHLVQAALEDHQKEESRSPAPSRSSG